MTPCVTPVVEPGPQPFQVREMIAFPFIGATVTKRTSAKKGFELLLGPRLLADFDSRSSVWERLGSVRRFGSAVQLEEVW